jgi:hypothetical protein
MVVPQIKIGKLRGVIGLGEHQGEDDIKVLYI